MIDDLLTPSFHMSEFLASETAARRGIDNWPDAVEAANIRYTLAPGMQRVRNLLGSPVIISSGYRSPRLNLAVGGSQRSQHTQGLAADFTCPGFGTPLAVAKHLMMRRPELLWDQLIWEGTWVHISFADKGKGRGEVLTAKFFASGVVYQSGLV